MPSLRESLGLCGGRITFRTRGAGTLIDIVRTEDDAVSDYFILADDIPALIRIAEISGWGQTIRKPQADYLIAHGLLRRRKVAG